MGPGHVMIVPMDHVAGMNEADEEVQSEVRRFKQVWRFRVTFGA